MADGRIKMVYRLTSMMLNLGIIESEDMQDLDRMLWRSFIDGRI